MRGEWNSGLSFCFVANGLDEVLRGYSSLQCLIQVGDDVLDGLNAGRDAH